jgi:phosphate transport system permease protein
MTQTLALSGHAAVQQRVESSLRRRARLERLFHGPGIGAVVTSILLVVIFFGSIVRTGLPAFWRSTFVIDVHFDPEVVQVSAKPEIAAGETPAAFRARLQQW